MDKEKIRQLRSKANIPLAKAIELLRLTNNNIEQAEQLFHQQNIDFIVESTDVEMDLAKQHYQQFDKNAEKAIQKIQQDIKEQEFLKAIITTRDDKIRHREIGFDFYAEDENCESYRQPNNQTFIPDKDFSYIIAEFRKVFPIYDYWSQSEQDNFEVCWQNTFDKQTCQAISNLIRKLTHDDPKVLQFFQDVSDWLDERLIYAHHIVVEGNL